MYKTANSTKKGLYKYIVMLFGHYNALVTFQVLISLTFADFFNKFAALYLDDILVCSETY